MGFEDLVKSIAQQLGVVLQAPIPFAVAIGIVALLMWKAMVWRYAGIIEHLREDVTYLERAVARKSQEGAAHSPLISSHQPASSVSSRSTASPEAARVYLDPSITPELIGKLRRDLSGMQADKITATYIGKWMRITGVIYQTGLASGEAFVHVAGNSRGEGLKHSFRSQVTMFFDTQHDLLTALKPGDPIQASGQVEDISDLGIILKHCELRP